MQQTKRSTYEDFNDNYQTKRQKTSNQKLLAFSCSFRRKSITILEDLCNELLYEIFEFLDLYDALTSFYGLNQRFQNLFVHSNLPIKVNISTISKSKLRDYHTNMIIPHIDRIRSFRLSNPFAGAVKVKVINMIRLQTLILDNILSDDIRKIVSQLPSLPVLSSLTIVSINNTRYQHEIYQKIFRLSQLKYCQLSIPTSRKQIPLPVAGNESSPIEHLVINNEISLADVHSLLSYVPQLRRLSLGFLNGRRNNRMHSRSIVLKYLSRVSLTLSFVSFHEFEQLIANFFHQIEVLRIEHNCSGYWFNRNEYLDADRWEQLISNLLANLKIFDFRYDDHKTCYFDQKTRVEQMNKFNSSFWTERQWFFEHQHYQDGSPSLSMLYSINPYRRRDYMLGEASNKNDWHCFHKKAVCHLYIRNGKAVDSFFGYFPNVKQLTLLATFGAVGHQVVRSLNPIIPLEQLTQMSLHYDCFPVEQIIQLLHCTPNIHTLNLKYLPLYPVDSKELFQIVSKTNLVKNITIERESALENIQLLVALFPRLEHLTVNLYKGNLKSIARFLLSKSNENTRHLCLFCISKEHNGMMGELKSLLDSENLLDSYTLKMINRKVYLWW